MINTITTIIDSYLRACKSNLKDQLIFTLTLLLFNIIFYFMKDKFNGIKLRCVSWRCDLVNKIIQFFFFAT